MKNIQDRYDKYGTLVASSYFQRYQHHFESIRVPFSALVEFLPAIHIQKEAPSKMAHNTIRLGLKELVEQAGASRRLSGRDDSVP